MCHHCWVTCLGEHFRTCKRMSVCVCVCGFLAWMLIVLLTEGIALLLHGIQWRPLQRLARRWDKSPGAGGGIEPAVVLKSKSRPLVESCTICDSRSNIGGSIMQWASVKGLVCEEGYIFVCVCVEACTSGRTACFTGLLSGSVEWCHCFRIQETLVPLSQSCLLSLGQQNAIASEYKRR